MNSPAIQARLARVVDSLFRSWPSLVGFSVQEARHLSHDRAAAPIVQELVLADVELSPWPEDARELCGAIALVLLKLIEDEPATRELLLERTFARVLH
jgi:hypothetical protein